MTDVKDVQARNEFTSSEVTPVADILMDCTSVEFWNTSSFIAVTLAPRVTFAGMGPKYPVKTPSTIIGPRGVPDTGVDLNPSPIVLTADTEIE
jgi:hypothetical protein